MMVNSNPSSDNLDSTHQLAAFLVGATTEHDYDHLAKLAVESSLSPMFLHHLKADHYDSIDATVLRQLKSLAQLHAMKFLAQEWAMKEINQALVEAGIRCIWFKGSALSYEIYPQAPLRTKSDLDCIVDSSDMDDALEILYSLGYERVPDNPDKLIPILYDRLSHHIVLEHPQNKLIVVELHRHLFGLSGPEILPPKHLKKWLDEAIDFQFSDQNALTFRPEYHLLYICAHAFLQHGEDKIGLRQLLDMHLIITKYSLNWDVLVNEAVALKWTFLTEYGLTRVQDSFATLIDSSVFNALRSQRLADEVIDYKHLQDREFVEGESIYEHLSKLNKRDQFTSILQLTFPSKYYMRQRYDIKQGLPVFPYYVPRFLAQVKNFIMNRL